jgi:small subunit ribosomal protein S21
MIKVKSRGNESVQQMIRRFKKMCEKEGLVKDIKRRRRRTRKSIKRIIIGS